MTVALILECRASLNHQKLSTAVRQLVFFANAGTTLITGLINRSGGPSPFIFCPCTTGRPDPLDNWFVLRLQFASLHFITTPPRILPRRAKIPNLIGDYCVAIMNIRVRFDGSPRQLITVPRDMEHIRPSLCLPLLKHSPGATFCATFCPGFKQKFNRPLHFAISSPFALSFSSQCRSGVPLLTTKAARHRVPRFMGNSRRCL